MSKQVETCDSENETVQILAENQLDLTKESKNKYISKNKLRKINEYP